VQALNASFKVKGGDFYRLGKKPCGTARYKSRGSATPL